MHVKYDSFNHAETPLMILCNPGSVYNPTSKAITNTVGTLPMFSDLELNSNFNAISELNFRAYKYPSVLSEGGSASQIATSSLRWSWDNGVTTLSSVNDNLSATWDNGEVTLTLGRNIIRSQYEGGILTIGDIIVGDNIFTNEYKESASDEAIALGVYDYVVLGQSMPATRDQVYYLEPGTYRINVVSSVPVAIGQRLKSTMKSSFLTSASTAPTITFTVKHADYYSFWVYRPAGDGGLTISDLLLYELQRIEDPGLYIEQMFDSIQNRRLIFIPDIGYFTITYVDSGREGNLTYKDVTAQSIEAEIQNKTVPYIEDNTYNFSDLMDMLMRQLPLWSIKQEGGSDAIPESISSKYRTFEDVDDTQNIYAFMLEEMQDAYECIFDFDCLKREITVYDQNNYVEPTDIFITHDDIINSIVISEDSNDLYTAITCAGEGDVGISGINPLGGNTIYNFDYYLPWMTTQLRERMLRWSALVDFYSTPATDVYIRSGTTALSADWLSFAKGGAALTPSESVRYRVMPEDTSKQVLGFYDYKCYWWDTTTSSYKGAGIGYHTQEENILPDPTIKRYSYYDLNLRYYSLLRQKSHFVAESSRLDTVYSMYERCRQNIVANGSTNSLESYNQAIVNNGGTAITAEAGIEGEIDALLARIDELMAEVASESEAVSSQLTSTDEQIVLFGEGIESIHNALGLENFFTPDNDGTLLAELDNYIYEGSYTDEYVVITDIMDYAEQFETQKTLYDRAKQQLEKVSHPTQEFSVDAENFIFHKDFESWAEQLHTGCLVNVELDQDDVAQLFLSAFSVNYEDHTLSMTFGNRFNKFDTKSLFNDVLGNVQKSANTLSYVKDIIYPIKNGDLNTMREILENSRTLTKDAALASTNQEIIIDDTGYLGRRIDESGEYSPHQIKITEDKIVFTEDAWESSQLAIGEIIIDSDITGEGGEGPTKIYGINAQAIIGDIIMGSELRILNGDGQDILSVTDDQITSHIETAIEDITKERNDAIDEAKDELNEKIDDANSKIDDLDDAINNENDGIIAKFTDLKRTVDSLDLSFGNITASGVETSTGFKFNEEGLNISRSDSNIQNQIDHTGMFVRTKSGNTTTDVLVANDQGVNAINLTARQYLIMGNNSRFEDYSNGTDTKRTACFFIGSSE